MMQSFKSDRREMEKNKDTSIKRPLQPNGVQNIQKFFGNQKHPCYSGLHSDDV